MTQIITYPHNIKVKLSPDRLGGLVLRPVSDRWAQRFRDRVVENGGPDEDTVYLQSLSEISDSLPAHKVKDLEEGWPVIVVMDPWDVGHYYGHNAHTVCETPAIENPIAVLDVGKFPLRPDTNEPNPLHEAWRRACTTA